MLPQEDIQKYGGKGAILAYVHKQLPRMPIPNFIVFEPEASLERIVSETASFNTPLIVRSSSPHEYAGFEGIFDSEANVCSRRELEDAITHVRMSATSERAKLYATQQNVTIDDKMSIIVQEQSPSTHLGAMMRHPNNPDIIFIGYHDNKGKRRNTHHRIAFDERTDSKADLTRFVSSADFSEVEAKFLVEKYKEIESLTQIAEGHSLFVEFGLNPFMIYQVRPFRKIETADFEVEYSKKGIYSDFCFGITPKEGIVLPVIRGIGMSQAVILSAHLGRFVDPNFSFTDAELCLQHDFGNIGFAHARKDISDENFYSLLSRSLKNQTIELDLEAEGRYCFMTSSAKREEFEIDLCLKKMEALVVGDALNFLTHDMMRLIKKADVTVAVPALFENELYRSVTSFDDKVRIISNGKKSIVIKE